MHPTTRRRLEAALAAEALATLRYRLFAEQAEDEGHDEIAELFYEIGKQERNEHFRALAELLGMVGTTHHNLRAALDGEITEHRALYTTFAAEARRHGDQAVATGLEALAGDESRHVEAFRRALEAIDAAERDGVTLAGELV